MRKRAKICFYIFVVCAFLALGILGYYVFNVSNDNVMVGQRKFVTFNAIRNAASYSVTVSDSLGKTGEAQYVVDKEQVNNKNSYQYSVDVYINDDIIAEESYLQEITGEDKEKGTIDCNIKNYTINYYGDDINNEQSKDTESGVKLTYIDQTLEDVNNNIFCIVVSEYFGSLFDKDGKYYISCTPLDKNGDPIIDEKSGENIIEEVEFEYIAYYEQDFERKGEFYYNGDWYDYIIEDVDELNAIVSYVILYREAQDSFSFYVKTDEINERNINMLVINAINNYPEYDALEEKSVYATMQDNICTLNDFEYYLDENFTKTYLNLQEEDEAIYNRALNSLQKIDTNYLPEYIRVDGETRDRTFYIDSVEDEVVVYNTEQLFMVVQSGARPIFIEGKSDVAKSVYDNALEVLKEINNSDDLTDYEKALNIYRYITSNVIYDHVTYAFMDLKGDFTIKSFGDYSCFYLEGVFYDFDGLENHYAVCDGLAKAYSLLCNIEGIDCFKVNGEIVGQGNHAWNKIYLDDEKYNANGWFYVDTTWGEGAYIDSDGEYYQILTHTYFLFSQDDSERIINYPENTESELPSSDYNYYANMKYNYNGEEIDCYIESDQELIDILNYADSQVSFSGDSKAVELLFDKKYFNTPNNLIKDILNREIFQYLYREIGINNRFEYIRLLSGDKPVVDFRFYK